MDLARYFGEEEPDCGSCDACRESGPAANRAPTAEEKVIVQKALSGVARMSARTGSGEWVGRFGRGKIMQMLLGSRSQEVLNARLDELSTYGLLEKFGAPFIQRFIRGNAGE
ncbi:MAG: RQC domain-containing protein [Verrucomicrobiales bacterium]